ncbi:cytochrome P450 [Lactifluus volemus]|nr:cytochrome P450 [Lactifluus volemus]
MRDWPIFTSLVCIFLVSRVVNCIANKKLVMRIPGPWVALSPLMPLSAALPTCRWNPGLAWIWKLRLSFYKKWGSEVVSFVPFLRGPPLIFTSSLEVSRQILAGGNQSVWVKPEWAMKVFGEWSSSVLHTNKDDWRRHRRIMGPAFNTSTYSIVWAETSRVYGDMISVEGWSQKDLVTLRQVQAYTTRLAFLVISTCGFGLPFRWEEPTETDDGGMGIQKAMRIWVDTVIVRLLTPSWVYKLPIKSLRDAATSSQVLHNQMAEIISERRAELNGEITDRFGDIARKDIFSLLIRASEEDSKFQLSNDEVVSDNIDGSSLFLIRYKVGNVFAIMFAGHESMASTLASTIGLLCLHSDVQEDLYEQIVDVVGHDREPTFEDFSRLEKVAHAFYEANRLYPAAFILIREATEDTILNIPNADNQPGTRQVAIPKGLSVIVDMIGIQYNPRYFPDPYKYDPSRWRGVVAESEEITAFSVGPRTCLGRKFAVVEAVCFLTLLIRDWMVEPIMNPGETGEQWRDRVMQVVDMKMTLSVKALPVRLRRRIRPASI